jgi:predicted glycoside hydrolase/deacetylase ChbG (UPF0249 family)
MIQLIINADDFGFSPGVNYGIMESFLNGIVNSTTMMMNMTGTEHAIQLAKKHLNLRVGVHLVLTCGKPLREDVPSLVGEDGHFHSLTDLPKANQISLEELEREWTAQIERFILSGLQPSHFDSHHHVHFIEEFQPVVKNLSKKFDLPVRRNGQIQVNGVKSFSDLSLFDFYGEGVAPNYFNKLAERIEDGKIVEIMCHPAYVDNSLLRGSSYTFKRLTEIEILTQITLPSNIMLYPNKDLRN